MGRRGRKRPVVQFPQFLAHALHGERLPDPRRSRLGHALPPGAVGKDGLQPRRKGRRIGPVYEDAQPICFRGGLASL